MPQKELDVSVPFREERERAAGGRLAQVLHDGRVSVLALGLDEPLLGEVPRPQTEIGRVERDTRHLHTAPAEASRQGESPSLEAENDRPSTHRARSAATVSSV